MQSKNRVVLASAGSGKTWNICHDVIRKSGELKKNVLIVCYTNEGRKAIEEEYCKQNNGVIDCNVKIYTWYQFLLKEMIKPYQRCVTNEQNYIRSISFKDMYGKINYAKRGTKRYFFTGRDIIANKASELAIHINELTEGAVIDRLEKIYSHIYIDEVQDLVGRDLDLLLLLFESKISIYCVGDHKQAILKTHNAKAHKGKSGENIPVFFNELRNKGMVSMTRSNYSRRFNKKIASFANMVYPGEEVNGVADCVTGHDGVFIIDRKDAHMYISHFQPQILRYDKRTDTMGYDAINFGVSKGLTRDRVLIFPNKVLCKFLSNMNVPLKSPSKYYIASTRPRYSLVFVLEDIAENEYFKYCTIEIEDSQNIEALEFISLVI